MLLTTSEAMDNSKEAALECTICELATNVGRFAKEAGKNGIIGFGE